MDTKFVQMLTIIYNKVYKSINNYYIDIFLCGGMSTKDKISLRDTLKERLRINKKIRVLYPEDLFIEFLNLNNEYDLLSLEQFLAENSDFICIVCESPGSLVELGAFANNRKTLPKIIAMVEEKRKRQNSFIMLGPIKTIKKVDKGNVIYYSEKQPEELYKKLVSRIKQEYKNNLRYQNRNKPINSIVGLHYFIPIVLYLYGSVEVDLMVGGLRKLLNNLYGDDLKDYSRLYNSSMKLLYKQKIITQESRGECKFYRLTNSGYDFATEMLNNLFILNRTKLIDGIRFDIMRNEYY